MRYTVNLPGLLYINEITFQPHGGRDDIACDIETEKVSDRETEIVSDREAETGSRWKLFKNSFHLKIIP